MLFAEASFYLTIVVSFVETAAANSSAGTDEKVLSRRIKPIIKSSTIVLGSKTKKF
jgi:hypothetical protein